MKSMASRLHLNFFIPEGDLKILPEWQESKARRAPFAPFSGERQSGRNKKSVRRSYHFPILSIGVSTTPGSAQFTIIPLSVSTSERSRANAVMTLYDRAYALRREKPCIVISPVICWKGNHERVADVVNTICAPLPSRGRRSSVKSLVL